MLSPLGERAIADATQYGRAILKFISANDVGRTGSHQCGYYLPKNGWPVFTEHPPEKGCNNTDDVKVTWQDGRVTDSAVKWYGNGSRSEYRMTRFGNDFPYLTEDNVGDLFILIPTDRLEFRAYVLDLESDIDEVQAALGVEVVTTAIYDTEAAPEPENENECIRRRFSEIVRVLEDFPPTKVFADHAWEVLIACVQRFMTQTPDKQLIEARKAEYELFGLAERLLCGPEVQRQFADIDDFLKTANTIMNRRKSRSGLSLEHHVERILSNASVPFERQPDIEGNPDIIIPHSDAYRDAKYPRNRIIVLGVKTTCKDRWRQVTREAQDVPDKHILTLQAGISIKQMNLMQAERVSLVVPKSLHRSYPTEGRGRLITVEDFLGGAGQLVA